MKPQTPDPAIRLADAVMAALSAGDDYHEAMDSYDSRIATKRETAALLKAEKTFKDLSVEAYNLAAALKGEVTK